LAKRDFIFEAHCNFFLGSRGAVSTKPGFTMSRGLAPSPAKSHPTSKRWNRGPTGEIPMPKRKDLFARVEPIALSVVGENQDIRIIHHPDLIIFGQQVVDKIVVLDLLSKGIGKIQI